MNLNVHFHALVLDGVFAQDGTGLRFHATPDLATADVADVLATVVPRVRRLLERRGFGDSDESGAAPDAWAEDAVTHAGTVSISTPRSWFLRVGPSASNMIVDPDPAAAAADMRNRHD